MKFAAKLVLTGALMLSIGAQWAVLQGVAWVGMAVSYSIREGSVSEGLSQTFDGKHPCPLCCAVKKGTQETSDDPVVPAPKSEVKSVKTDMILSASLRLRTPPFGRLPVVWEAGMRTESRMDAPDGPPPEMVA
ncbi:MAG: hypothetical protein KDM64_00575 [Verrucomicrobiae bacterium]|nr:hypothetical protein [Verrucomicrobiae bacterium]